MSQDGTEKAKMRGLSLNLGSFPDLQLFLSHGSKSGDVAIGPAAGLDPSRCTHITKITGGQSGSWLLCPV